MRLQQAERHEHGDAARCGRRCAAARESAEHPVAALKSYLLSNRHARIGVDDTGATGGRLNVFNAANAVAANPVPAVNITSRLPCATFIAPAGVTVSANASDANGILRVEFYAGTTLIGTDTASPHTASLRPGCLRAVTRHAKRSTTSGHDDVCAGDDHGVALGHAVGFTVSSAVAFAKQRVGTTRTGSQAVTITNNGPGPLVFATFNGAAPASAFTIGGGDFQGQTNCPLTGPGLSPATFCTFTFRFSPTAVGPRAANFSIGSNAINSPHAIALTGTGFLVDEATVSATIASGGARLQSLQQLDGGWFFKTTDTECGHGAGVSCGNIIGVTGLAVLSAYARTNNPAMLADAVQAGTRLIAVYNAAPRTALQPGSRVPGRAQRGHLGSAIGRHRGAVVRDHHGRASDRRRSR